VRRLGNRLRCGCLATSTKEHLMFVKMARAPDYKERLAQQAIDGVQAMADYRADEVAVRKRTARLRAERLAREAADPSKRKRKLNTRG
jgi:hypothetical protein